MAYFCSFKIWWLGTQTNCFVGNRTEKRHWCLYEFESKPCKRFQLWFAGM